MAEQQDWIKPGINIGKSSRPGQAGRQAGRQVGRARAVGKGSGGKEEWIRGNGGDQDRLRPDRHGCEG